MLYITIEIPGSGKSTFAEANIKLNDNIIVCSSDAIRKELYGDENIQGDGATVFRTLISRTLNYLKQGKDVIYDATNITRKSRKRILKLAKENNYETCAVYFNISLDVCLERNANRNRKVPEDIIKTMFYKMQVPEEIEGFDEIITITE